MASPAISDPEQVHGCASTSVLVIAMSRAEGRSTAALAQLAKEAIVRGADVISADVRNRPLVFPDQDTATFPETVLDALKLNRFLDCGLMATDQFWEEFELPSVGSLDAEIISFLQEHQDGAAWRRGPVFSRTSAARSVRCSSGASTPDERQTQLRLTHPVARTRKGIPCPSRR